MNKRVFYGILTLSFLGPFAALWFAYMHNFNENINKIDPID